MINGCPWLNLQCVLKQFWKICTEKKNKCGLLLNDIEPTWFTCELITMELGSRGLVSIDNRSKLTTIFSHLNGSKQTSHWTKNNLSRTSVLASYAIFYSTYASEWVDPPLIVNGNDLCIQFFFNTPRSRFDNTVNFDITLTPNVWLFVTRFDIMFYASVTFRLHFSMSALSINIQIQKCDHSHLSIIVWLKDKHFC